MSSEPVLVEPQPVLHTSRRTGDLTRLPIATLPTVLKAAQSLKNEGASGAPSLDQELTDVRTALLGAGS
jgi:hypothetical protein